MEKKKTTTRKNSIDGNLKTPDSLLTKFLERAEITIKDVINYKKEEEPNNGQNKQQ